MGDSGLFSSTFRCHCCWIGVRRVNCAMIPITLLVIVSLLCLVPGLASLSYRITSQRLSVVLVAISVVCCLVAAVCCTCLNGPILSRDSSTTSLPLPQIIWDRSEHQDPGPPVDFSLVIGNRIQGKQNLANDCEDARDPDTRLKTSTS